MSVKVAIIHYSSTGTTYELARAVEEGAKEAGAEIRFRKVKELAPREAVNSNEKWKNHAEKVKDIPEASLEDLEWADAIILGTPTRYGSPSSQLKNFMDQTGPLWMKGKLVNKIASSFVTIATQHGGHESTILAMNNTYYHWGCIIVGPGYADPLMFKSGNPYGASFTSQNGELDPDETSKAAAKFQGKRVVEVTEKFNS